MHFLDTLNPEQRDAVLHIDGPLLILAGAGSGKTRVITQPHRLPRRRRPRRAGRSPRRHLHQQGRRGDARARRGAARRRLQPACGSRRSTRCARGCCAARRRAIGLSRDFVIYDSSDQLSVVKQALKELHIDDSFVQPRAALSRISHAKNRMEGPESFAAARLEPRATSRSRKVYALLPERAEGQRTRSTSTTCC